MSSSFTRSYNFKVDGRVRVPHHSYSYAGETLYRKSGESYSSVHLPRDLVTGVPDEVSYHDSVDVELEVDGRPFDRSVDSCSDTVTSLKMGIDRLTGDMGELNGEVQGLTNGVCKLTGATTAAAVGISGAKVASSETISSSLTRGFSKYISYLIHERLMELEAKIPSTASTFSALSKSLARRKDVLQRDYERISDRYSKLFVRLNDELKGRLLELDRPAFENCAQMQSVIFTNPMGFILGQSVCAGAEQLQAADAVRVSRLKGTTETAMEIVKDYVKVVKRLSAAVNGVLSNHKVEATQSLKMPVVRMESDDVVTKEKGNLRTFIPQWFESTRDVGFGNELADSFASCPRERKSAAEMEIVDGCFKKRASQWVAASGNVNPRITERVLALWEKSKQQLCN